MNSFQLWAKFRRRFFVTVKFASLSHSLEVWTGLNTLYSPEHIDSVRWLQVFMAWHFDLKCFRLRTAVKVEKLGVLLALSMNTEYSVCTSERLRKKAILTRVGLQPTTSACWFSSADVLTGSTIDHRTCRGVGWLLQVRCSSDYRDKLYNAGIKHSLFRVSDLG